jgi:ATPase subunit of ABC transporter with duplicated ATPase domains
VVDSRALPDGVIVSRRFTDAVERFADIAQGYPAMPNRSELSVSGDRGISEMVISARGLRMAYGELEAVRGIDLDVPRGEVFAFLGPNGAGKTTTVGVQPQDGRHRLCMERLAGPLDVKGTR